MMKGNESRLTQVGMMSDLVSLLGQEDPSKQWKNWPDKLSEGLGLGLSLSLGNNSRMARSPCSVQ